MAYNIDDIYDSIIAAEHISGKSQWRRTEGRGSSAYGPVQLTGGNVSKMWDAYHDEYQSKKLNLKEDERQYISRFLEQADRFLDPVSDEDFSTYGYGGPGVLTSDEDKALYESVSKKIMNFELDHRYGGNVKEFIKRWRGPTKKYIPGGKDPGNKTYFDKFWGKYDKLTAKRKNKNDIDSLMPDEAIMDSVLKEVR